MRGCILTGANLLFAVFQGADVQDADFSGARLSFTIFAGVDLSRALGLKEVTHDGPSHLDAETFRESGSSLPPEFLSGCGLQRWEIIESRLYAPQLTADDIRRLCDDLFAERASGKLMRRTFISYSHADGKFVDKLHKRLKQEGVVVWLDKHELSAGTLQKQINRAMSEQDVVILVLSEHSLQSDWVENELEMARDKEKQEGRDVVCPIAIDDVWTKQTSDNNHPNRALWRKLREKYVIDFSKWRTKAFEESFKKLVHGIRMNYAPKDK